jgi:hypothetical protein
METTDSAEIIDTHRTDRRQTELPTPTILDTQLQQYPEGAIDAVLYTLGFQMWEEPSSPSEEAEQAAKLTTGIYAIICITNTQFEERHAFSPPPNWHQIRSYRTHVFATCFNRPEFFNELEYESPDDMFDAVEIGLEANGLIGVKSPPRDTQFINDLALYQPSTENDFK